MKTLNKTTTVETFVGVCRAVEYIYGKGYLHNDLKANNVVLEQSNDSFRPIIIDFGKSKPIGKSLAVRKRRYTGAYYIAPEVRNGLQATTASDVYSLRKMLDRTVSVVALKVYSLTSSFKQQSRVIQTDLHFVKLLFRYGELKTLHLHTRL